MAHRGIESNKSRNHIKEGAVLGALSVGLAFLADTQVGNHGRRKYSDKADVVSNIRPGEHAIFTVPGYHSNGRVIGKNLDRHFEEMGTTHYAVHPETGFSLDSIREAWLEARKKDGHRPAKIYAMSMGALLVAKMFSDDRFREEFGEVETYVMDGGLSGKKDVSLTSKIAMAAGAILPVTYSTGKLYRYISSRDLKNAIEHAAEVTPGEAYEHHRSSADTHFSAAKDQIFFMNGNSVDQMNLAPFGASIGEHIIYLTTRHDEVLNPNRAVQETSDAYERDIELWIDRKHLGHAIGPEFPQVPKDALMYQNRDRYAINTIRHHMVRSASGLWLPDAQPDAA